MSFVITPFMLTYKMLDKIFRLQKIRKNYYNLKEAFMAAKRVLTTGLGGSGGSSLTKELLTLIPYMERLSKWHFLDWFYDAVNNPIKALPYIKFFAKKYGIDCKIVDINNLCQENTLEYANFYHVACILAMIQLSEEINRRGDDEVIIVCKWIESEITTYHLMLRALDAPACENVLRIDYESLPIVKPDIVLHVQPPFGVRNRRILDRDKPPNYRDIITMTPKAEIIMEEQVRRWYGSEYYVINNDKASEETVAEAMGYITQEKLKRAM